MKKKSYKREVSRVVLKHHIPLDITLNLHKTPLSYVSPGKCTFCLKGSTTVPIKDVAGKHQITAKFTVSATGTILLVQLTYQGTTERSSQIQVSKTVQRYVYKEPLFQSQKIGRSIWKKLYCHIYEQKRLNLDTRENNFHLSLWILLRSKTKKRLNLFAWKTIANYYLTILQINCNHLI